jgi:peroxin-13
MVIDPRKLDFYRAQYDYTPDSPDTGIDLTIGKDDLVAILSKTDPVGSPSE